MKRWLHPVIALVVIAAGAITIGVKGFDRELSHRYFLQNRGDLWPYGDMPPWIWIEDYGNLLGIAMMATGAWLVFRSRHDLKARRARAGLVMLFTVLLGPGLIVNATLKTFWGRPRPRNLDVYWGDFAYREFWQYGGPTEEESFPSGHAAMAFSLVAAVLVMPRRRRLLVALAMAVALGWGVLVAYTRIRQGAHFLSDVWVGGGIGYLCAASLAVWFGDQAEAGDIKG